MARRKTIIVSLLVGAVLGSVVTFGAFQVSKSRNLKWADWTGFGKGTTKEVTTEKSDKVTETIKYQSGKTLWDWLELTGTLAIPILIAYLSYQFEQQNQKEQARLERDRNDKQIELEKQRQEQARFEKERAEKQAEVEREIAKDNLAEEAIQTYLDNFAKLLLDKELRKELFPNVNDKFNILDKDNPVRDVARTQTITILRRLEGDKERQARILNFLRDAELYGFIFENANLSTINLAQANLREANLRGADLSKADLTKADLLLANLSKANLTRANLKCAYPLGANLESAILFEANLEDAKLWTADLTKANLLLANLSKAILEDVNLESADFMYTNLMEAILIDTQNLTSTQIKSACFWETAIYKGEWNKEKQTHVAIEPDNTKFIQELKNDTASNPDEHPDCSRWENQK